MSHRWRYIGHGQRCIVFHTLQVQWKAYGNKGMAARIEECFENALYLRDQLEATDGFRLLLSEPECTNVCFWYIPQCMRGQPETPEWWEKLSKVGFRCIASVPNSCPCD